MCISLGLFLLARSYLTYLHAPVFLITCNFDKLIRSTPLELVMSIVYASDLFILKFVSWSPIIVASWMALYDPVCGVRLTLLLLAKRYEHAFKFCICLSFYSSWNLQEITARSLISVPFPFYEKFLWRKTKTVTTILRSVLTAHHNFLWLDLLGRQERQRFGFFHRQLSFHPSSLQHDEMIDRLLVHMITTICV